MKEETYNRIEEALNDRLDYLKDLENGCKEEGPVIADIRTFGNLLNEIDRERNDENDKWERRRIEETRNETNAELEREKHRLTVGKVVFELTKLAVPIVVGAKFYDGFQKRVMKYEETGRVSSTAGRELHLPRFWK